MGVDGAEAIEDDRKVRREEMAVSIVCVRATMMISVAD